MIEIGSKFLTADSISDSRRIHPKGAIMMRMNRIGTRLSFNSRTIFQLAVNRLQSGGCVDSAATPLPQHCGHWRGNLKAICHASLGSFGAIFGFTFVTLSLKSTKTPIDYFYRGKALNLLREKMVELLKPLRPCERSNGDSIGSRSLIPIQAKLIFRSLFAPLSTLPLSYDFSFEMTKAPID